MHWCIIPYQNERKTILWFRTSLFVLVFFLIENVHISRSYCRSADHNNGTTAIILILTKKWASNAVSTQSIRQWTVGNCHRTELIIQARVLNSSSSAHTHTHKHDDDDSKPFLFWHIVGELSFPFEWFGDKKKQRRTRKMRAGNRTSWVKNDNKHFTTVSQ